MTQSIHVGSYERVNPKTGKVEHVDAYTSVREAAKVLMEAAGRPPMAGTPATKSAQYPHGRSVPGIFPPKAKPPSQKRFATRAEDARLMQGQTQGNFIHHGTGAKMGKTEIGDTYEQMFMLKFSHEIADKYGGSISLVTGAGGGSARNTPLDFATPTHGGELKTLSIKSKNQKTAIKAEEIARKLKAIDDRGLKPLLLVQVVDQDSGTVHVYGLETFASKAVSKMEHLGEYRYDTTDFQTAQEASGHASKAEGRAEAERSAAGPGDLGGGGRGTQSAERAGQQGTERQAGEQVHVAGGRPAGAAAPTRQLGQAGDASEGEVQALDDYTGYRYDTVNADLRSGHTLDANDQLMADQLDRLMGRSTLARDETVYRGGAFTPEFIAMLKLDGEVSDGGFMSTTVDKQIAHKFALEMSAGGNVPVHFAISMPKGTYAIDVEHHIQNPLTLAEKEYVLARGSRLRITDVSTETSDGYYVKAELIDQRWVPQEQGGGVHSKLSTAELSAKIIWNGVIGLSNTTEDAWAAAAEEGIQHLLLVLKNNPAKTVASALARPDVQQAIEEAGQQGALAVMAEIRSVWEANGGDPDSPYLASLLRDAQHNGTMYPHRMGPVLTQNDHGAAKAIMERDRIRAAAGGDVAATRARTEAMVAQLQSDGIKFARWRAHIDDRTCQWCLSLDGAIVPVGSQFPISGPEPYFDLVGPPRHPNCRCELEAAD